MSIRIVNIDGYEYITQVNHANGQQSTLHSLDDDRPTMVSKLLKAGLTKRASEHGSDAEFLRFTHCVWHFRSALYTEQPTVEQQIRIGWLTASFNNRYNKKTNKFTKCE